MEVTGQVVKVTPVQGYGANNFQKGEIWVAFYETIQDKQYERKYPLTYAGKNAEKMIQKDPKVGDTVECKFELRSNEYNDKLYVELSAWYLDVKERGADGGSTAKDDSPF